MNNIMINQYNDDVCCRKEQSTREEHDDLLVVS